MLPDTSFLYEETGEESCFSTVSKILMVDKESRKEESGNECRDLKKAVPGILRPGKVRIDVRLLLK